MMLNYSPYFCVDVFFIHIINSRLISFNENSILNKAFCALFSFACQVSYSPVIWGYALISSKQAYFSSMYFYIW